MKMIIIPQEIAEKLRQTEFPKPHALDPVVGEMDGKEVYFLQADLKENPIFEAALKDFEVCEVKDIETVEIKYYDTKGIEITTKESIDPITNKIIISYEYSDKKEVDIVDCDFKVILVEYTILKKAAKIFSNTYSYTTTQSLNVIKVVKLTLFDKLKQFIIRVYKKIKSYIT